MFDRLVNNIEVFLTNKNGYKKSWTRIFMVYAICIAVFAVLLSLKVSWIDNHSSSANQYWIKNEEHFGYITQSFYISITGLCFLGLPILVILSSWIVGINQTTKSKYYHLFFYIIAFIAFILALAVSILMIRSSIETMSIYN